MDKFVPHSIDDANSYEVELVGDVKAGFPSPAGDIREKLDLIKLLVKHKASTFFFRVDGVSGCWRALHIRTRAYGLAHEAARTCPQSIRPNRAFYRRLVCLSVLRTVLSEGLGYVCISFRFFCSHDGCGDGGAVGAC